MKKFIFILLGILLTTIGYSQKDTIIYDEGSTTNYTYYDSAGVPEMHYTVVPPASEAQVYVDWPKELGIRTPWGYRQYEKWQMQQIHHVDIVIVDHYYRKFWRRGLMPFTGDTTKLVHVGWARPEVLDRNNPISNMAWKVYELRDTIYTVPTYPEGFNKWKALGRPKVD